MIRIIKLNPYKNEMQGTMVFSLTNSLLNYALMQWYDYRCYFITVKRPTYTCFRHESQWTAIVNVWKVHMLCIIYRFWHVYGLLLRTKYEDFSYWYLFKVYISHIVFIEYWILKNKLIIAMPYVLTYSTARRRISNEQL